MIHELKTWLEPFNATWAGKKKFELRKNDRNFQVGDLLRLVEYNENYGYCTGRYIMAKISYVLPEGFGLPTGYVILQLKKTANRKNTGSRASRTADMFYILQNLDSPCAQPCTG